MKATENALVSEVMLKLDQDADLSRYRKLYFSASARASGFYRFVLTGIVNGKRVEYTTSIVAERKNVLIPRYPDTVYVGVAHADSLTSSEIRNGKWTERPAGNRGEYGTFRR